MGTKRILLVLLGCIFSFFAQAQDDEATPKNLIKINIFSPIVRTISLTYEHAVSEKNSVALNAFYTGASISETRFRGFGITPEYRFYLSENKPAPEGFYIAPFARYQNFDLSLEDNPDDKATLSTIGGGVLIGGQWVFNKRIAVDTFIGPSYSGGDVKVSSSSTTEDFETGLFSGFGIRFGLTVGVAF